MSRDTNKALSEITDEGLFEEVATGVLREAHPLCAGLAHPGVNAEGKTRKAPVDAFTIISDGGTPHLIAVHHTITAAKSLERKWLFDPNASSSRRPRGAAPRAGDLIKTASIVAAERKRTPQLLATLILTTNEEPGEDLFRDAKAAGDARRIAIDIWSRSRIAHFLDNTSSGQWIRRRLSIESELLSRALLRELSRLSLDRGKPVDDARAWVPRALDGILVRSRQPATFVVAESGHGKTVASYRALKMHVESGGAGLVLPHEVLEEATTLEGAIGEALHRLHPRLARGQSALEHCAPDHPLFVIVEDINRSGHAQRLLEKLTAWTGSNESSAALRLICPVWPRVLASVNEQTRRAVEPMLLFPDRMTPQECQAAVILRVRQVGRDMSELTADQLAAQLGYDPLLIALHDYDTEADPHDVIGGFVERALVRAQEQGATVAHALRAALMQLAEQMLRRRKLDPTWAEVESWELSDKHIQCIALIAKAEELVRLVGSIAEARLVFRHDRVRDWLLVERMIELDAAHALSDDLVSEPFYAEIVGALLVRCRAPSGLTERIGDLNALALFHALRLVGDDLTPRATILAAIDRWLGAPATRTTANIHVRWHAVAALEMTDGDDIPGLIRRFPERSPSGYLAALHNGDVEAAIRVCAMFEFGTGARFRDRQIEHAKLHFGERLLAEISDRLLGLRSEEDAARQGLLELSGHLGEPALVPALETCWRVDPSPDRRYQEYLWAFARCCADDEAAARNLASICDAWAALPSHAEVENRPSPRDEFGADDLHWAFKRSPPRSTALRYFVMRGRQPELSWQITYMLNGVDDPVAVQQVVDYAAEETRRSADGSAWVGGRLADGWRNRKNFELGYMSPRSRDPLYEQWSSSRNDPAQRQAAFRVWSATEGIDDLATLRVFQSDALLGESVLIARLLRSDTTAVPALIEKLRQGESGFRWWPLARNVWSPEFLIELDRTLESRRGLAVKSWNEIFKGDYNFTDLIARVPVQHGERLLLRHWDHVRFSPRFVQIAFYVGTPELRRIAGVCLRECPDPGRLLEHISSTYGIRLARHPGVTREAQVLVLEPYIHLLTNGDRLRLADACNEAGWHATRRRLFDEYLTNSGWMWKFDEAPKSFDELLVRNRHAIRFEIGRAMRAGGSWAEIFRALTSWLETQESLDALKMVVEAVIAHGSREDVASLHFVGHANEGTAPSLIADAIYAVRRRSLQ